MPAYWMISNRTVKNDGFGVERAPTPTFWISDKGPLDNFKNWKSISVDQFKTLLIGAADQFPPLVRRPEFPFPSCRGLEQQQPGVLNGE